MEVHVALQNWAVTGRSFEVPAHTEGHLISEGSGGPNQPGSTAVVYTLDCTRVAELDIQGEHALVYIDPEGKASALTGPKSDPSVSPAATEAQIESVAGCHAPQGPTPREFPLSAVGLRRVPFGPCPAQGPAANLPFVRRGSRRVSRKEGG